MARKVHTSELLVEIAHLRNVLEAEGIRCSVRNDRLGGVVGEIPFVECWPELWVDEDRHVQRAQAVIRDVLSARPTGRAWRCARCDEAIEGQFEQCWSCGAERPVAGDRA